MNLSDLRKRAATGDILLVHGNSFVQEGIQLATGIFCHVAQLFIPASGGLFVEEMLEGTGYQNMTLDDWLAGRPDDKIYLGTAPPIVVDNGQKILDRFGFYIDHEHREYHYDELLKVLLFDKTGQVAPADGEVCSLLVIDNWRVAGYEFTGNPSPSDFLDLCESISFIR